MSAACFQFAWRKLARGDEQGRRDKFDLEDLSCWPPASSLVGANWQVGKQDCRQDEFGLGDLMFSAACLQFAVANWQVGKQDCGRGEFGLEDFSCRLSASGTPSTNRQVCCGDMIYLRRKGCIEFKH